MAFDAADNCQFLFPAMSFAEVSLPDGLRYTRNKADAPKEITRRNYSAIPTLRYRCFETSFQLSRKSFNVSMTSNSGFCMSEH